MQFNSWICSSAHLAAYSLLRLSNGRFCRHTNKDASKNFRDKIFDQIPSKIHIQLFKEEGKVSCLPVWRMEHMCLSWVWENSWTEDAYVPPVLYIICIGTCTWSTCYCLHSRWLLCLFLGLFLVADVSRIIQSITIRHWWMPRKKTLGTCSTNSCDSSFLARPVLTALWQ